mgnify:FL=1
MTIAITGSTGFIGMHLLAHLQREGYSFVAIVRPKTDVFVLTEKGVSVFVDHGSIEALKTFFLENRVKGVIHLATLFLKTHQPDQVHDLIECNIEFGTRVLQAASQAKVNWFINTGTFWQHYQNREYSPVNLYAATKQAFEDIAQYYAETQLIIVVTLKINDTYGPKDTRPKIINIWKQLTDSNENLQMSGGEQLLDMVYIDDVTDAFVHLLKLLNENATIYNGKCYVLSSGVSISLKQLAGVFEKEIGKPLHIQWGAKPYQSREVMIPWQKGIPLPGWEPKQSIEAGIREILESKYKEDK